MKSVKVPIAFDKEPSCYDSQEVFVGTGPENTQHNVTLGQPHQTRRHRKQSSPNGKEMYVGHFFSWIKSLLLLFGRKKTN